MINIHRQIHNHLQHARKVVIVTHQNPDGDTLGSASAMTEYLKAVGIKPTIFCLSQVPNYYTYLPHVDSVSSDKLLFADKNIDTIIFLDSGDMRYAGVAGLLDNHPAAIINIDHHPTNEKYGHLNLVDSKASSTTEIIFHFFRYNGVRICNRKATALLTGIMTDTGNFSNSATSISAVTIAGYLLRAGANLRLINKSTVQNNSINILKLWGLVLDRLEHHPDKEMVFTYLKQEDYIKHQVEEKEADGIANFMNSIDGVKIGLFIKELGNGKVKGSFRTVHNDVDVAALAKKLGGGGHKKAAGFTAEGSIPEVLKRILTLE